MDSWFRLVMSELFAGLTLRKPAAPGAGAATAAVQHGFWRRQLEGFTVAIAMALILKQFTFDTFQVPTESMEPVIIGRGDLGDRLLVDRFAYMFKDPSRYDIVVFKYPLSRLVNYVKRAVGLPGERIKIWHGQIYADATGGTDFRITRKPDGVQDAIFRANPVIPEEEVSELTKLKLMARWRLESTNPNADPDPDFDVTAHAVKVRAAANADQFLALRNGVTDARLDPMAKDAKGTGGGHESVADLRVALEAQPAAGCGAVVIEIHDPAQPGQPIRLECGVEGGLPTRVLHGSKDVSTPDLGGKRIAAGRRTKVQLDHADHRIIVRLDGTEVYRYDYVVAPVDVPGGGRPAIAKIGVRSGEAALSSVAMYRDVHYTKFDTVTDEFQVPADSYLMLGDNSPNSLDARGWERTRIRIRESKDDQKGIVVDGDFEAVSDRVENSRRLKNPYPDDAGKPAFIDVQGNLWHLTPGLYDILDAATGEVRVPAVEDIQAVDSKTYAVFAHYTPRSYVVGRAAIVFFAKPRFLR